jgi:hypothetical protein
MGSKVEETSIMSRFQNKTVEDSPSGSRSMLQAIAQSAPNGRPLNVHAQMANAPAVLAGYTSLRAVTVEHGTLGPKVSWALNLATAATIGNAYMIGIASRFAGFSGWAEAQIEALRAGGSTGDEKIDALTSVIREATVHAGKVTDETWKAAQAAGWSDAELAEAFAYLGLTVFTGYFLNYAQTKLDG